MIDGVRRSWPGAFLVGRDFLEKRSDGEMLLMKAD